MLARVILELTQRGYRIGAAKHAHSVTEFDLPGKDSHALRNAGASAVLVGGVGQAALFFVGNPSLWTAEDMRRLLPEVDLIIVEGFKSVTGPRIVVLGDSTGDYPDAIATVGPGGRFDRDDVTAVADFILDYCHLPRDRSGGG